jgi:hypothetical protein
MTTYQDPPLQSRRAARQSERTDAASPMYPGTSTTQYPTTDEAALTTPESLIHATQMAPAPDYDAPGLRGRRAAEAPDDAAARAEAGYRVRDFSPDARRTALQNWSQTAPTPGEGNNLTYQTQQRPPMPPAPAEPAAPQQLAPQQQEPQAPAPVAAPQAPAADPLLNLPEHTLSRRELRALREAQGLPVEPEQGYGVAPSEASTVPPVAAAVAPVAQQPFPQVAEPVAAAIPSLVEPAPWPQPQSEPAAQAPSEPQAYSAPTHYTDPPAPNQATTTGDQFSAFEALFGVAQAPGQPDAVALAPQPVYEQQQTAPPQYAEPQQYTEPPQYAQPAQQTTPPQYVEPQQYTEPPQYAQPAQQTTPPQYSALPVAEVAATAEPVAAAQAPEVPLAEAPLAQAPVAEASAAEALVADIPVSTSERPVGHWSRQAEMDDEVQVAPGSISREVGGGVITTSALVLPEIPHHDFTRTLTSTGDVMMTGSIDLPRSLSSTGAMPAQLDESDIDHLLDPDDRQVASTDSQPVRAVKAVSTHTSSRGIINAAPPKRGNKMLTALIISASAMLVVVVGLAIVIVASGLLS